jgi:hypothetical protein
MRALREDRRKKRRTIADALDVMRHECSVPEISGAEIRVDPFALPCGEPTATVAVVCPDLDCFVSLPASWWFTALSEERSQRHRFEISCLNGAKVGPDGAILLTDGRWWRGVEMVPTHMPYELSPVEERILLNVIRLTKSYGCFRNLRDDLPQHLQPGIPNLWVLDYGRLHVIPRCRLKAIKAHIEIHDPELSVSNQKIADALIKCGVRIPRRRPRRVNEVTAARATI